MRNFRGKNLKIRVFKIKINKDAGNKIEAIEIKFLIGKNYLSRKFIKSINWGLETIDSNVSSKDIILTVTRFKFAVYNYLKQQIIYRRFHLNVY